MARRKAASPPASPPEGAKPSPSTADPLEEFLPYAAVAGPEVHRHAAVLEVGDPAQLLELAADTALRPFLLCRLATTVALVDPGRADELAEVLRRRGYTPKILKS
jgi:hypothetical protein